MTRVVHTRSGVPVASADIELLPGCSQIAVVHNAFVAEGQRGNGIGTEAHYARLNELRGLMFDLALCTSDATNEAQNKILEKAGWECWTSFVSRKTGHRVLLWTRHL